MIGWGALATLVGAIGLFGPHPKGALVLMVIGGILLAIGLAKED